MIELDLPSLFSYKNGTPIQFYKCKKCGEIITGCLHHVMECCNCENFIDQEDYMMRGSGEFENITKELSEEEKCKVFTKTVFKSDENNESWIKSRIAFHGYADEIFDIKEYKRLWEEGNV
jgi:hypothetical protein